ncbi:agglutinin-2-like [Pistacia vera]|uniref:agglutinin-2-like n=1 Tax=Pistacia vera TaxID=55513 RepID=UPI0012632939|nr:agglutinin-2-like [Pistacia vera]
MNKALPLWDKTTRKLTDFTTHFSFVIDSQNRTSYGDGLAFFLAPGGSIIPTVKGGGSFGHTKDDEPLNSTSNPFVAVEFDIFYNIGWDPIPSSDHVGIDISSMRSSTNVSWWSSVEGGQRNEAWISYNSSTQNLSVAFTGFRNNVTVMQYLDYEIDLRLYLPELVTFGFSAATGSRYAIFSVYSWEFNSSLEAANRHHQVITRLLSSREKAEEE